MTTVAVAAPAPRPRWRAWQALSWEYVRLSWRYVLGTMVASAALAAFFHGYVSAELGPGRDRVTFTALFAMLFVVNVATVMSCREPGRGMLFDARLYRLPVATWQLVVARLIGASVAAALMVVAVSLFMRVVLGAWWPIAAPLLVTVAAVAWLHALGWAFGSHPLLFSPFAAASAAASAVWIMPRLRVDEPLASLALSEVVTLVGVWLFAWLLAVWGVSLDRAGRGPAVPGLRLPRWKRAQRGTSAREQATRGAVQPPIGGAAAAQIWMEWREKGWVLPVWCAAGVLVNGGLGIVTGVGTAEVALNVLSYPALVILMTPPVAGFLYGRFSMSSNEAEIDPFRARRPLSDWRLAWTLLGGGAIALLATWVTAGVVAAGMLFCMAVWGDPGAVQQVLGGAAGALFSLPGTTIAYIVSGTLAFAWIAMGLTLTIAVTGRNWVFTVLAAIPYGLVALALFSGGVDRLRPLAEVLVIIEQSGLATLLLAVVLVALAAAPLALAPRALAWNRHR